MLVVAVHVGRCYIPDRSQHCVFQVIPLTLVPGIRTSTNISASKIPPQQDSDLVNTLGGNELHSQII